MSTSRTYKTKIITDPDGGSMTAIDVPFDPKAMFGKVRAPVSVKLNGYTFRSTIFRMDGGTWIPLCREHREGAGVRGGQTLSVTLTLDEAPRTVDVPRDLASALKAANLRETFDGMSFTHRREYAEAVEDAKKPETRRSRIEKCVAAMKARKAAPGKKPAAKAK